MLIMKYLCSVGPGRVNVVGAGRGNSFNAAAAVLYYYLRNHQTITDNHCLYLNFTRKIQTKPEAKGRTNIWAALYDRQISCAAFRPHYTPCCITQSKLNLT